MQLARARVCCGGMSSYGFEVVEPEHGTVRIDLSGELDLTNAAELELRLVEAAPSDVRLVLDLNRVSFVDSAAIHLLFELARRRGWDGLAVVLDPDAQIARTLEIVELARVTTVAASLEELAISAERP